MHDLIQIQPEGLPDYIPLEVVLRTADDFLKVKETLTRIGIASKKNNTLYQSCHILHKAGRYFVIHFKELFLLDGRPATLERADILRRNTIGCLLQDWGLVTVVDPRNVTDRASSLTQIKIIGFEEKSQWILIPKYNIGKKKT